MRKVLLKAHFAITKFCTTKTLLSKNLCWYDFQVDWMELSTLFPWDAITASSPQPFSSWMHLRLFFPDTQTVIFSFTKITSISDSFCMTSFESRQSVTWDFQGIESSLTKKSNDISQNHPLSYFTGGDRQEGPMNQVQGESSSSLRSLIRLRIKKKTESDLMVVSV